jgi:hypothetical protein
MPFRLPKATRQFFDEIVTTGSSGRNDENKFIWFDAYYLCLLVGLGKAKISPDTDNALLESGEFVDYYPEPYFESRDYIAGLLIATEAERKGIPKDDAVALQKLMLSYVDYESSTRLSKTGHDILNQYAARGIDIIKSAMSAKPFNVEVFLREYFMHFKMGDFLSS